MGYSVLVLTISTSALGGLVFGYELGIISGALPQLRSTLGLGCVQQEALVGSLLAGSLCACATGGWLIDRHGRRASVLLSVLLLLVGSVLLSAGASMWLLVSGRAMVGFSISVSSMSCCILVSELVVPERRGLMVTLYEGGITVGILSAYAVNYIFSAIQSGWRYMFGLAVVPALVQLLAVVFLPSDRPAPVRHMGMIPFTLRNLFGAEANMRRRTAVGLGLVLGQQCSGQPNVLLYASTILRAVGFRSGTSAVLASVALGLVKVVATLLAMLCSDRAGRRPLLIRGAAVMSAALLLTGLLCGHLVIEQENQCSPSNWSTAENHSAVENRTHDTPEMYKWSIFIGLMVVVAAFSVSFGPMTWLVLSEIFPQEVRGRAFSFINFFNVAANLVVSFSFLSVTEVIGLSGMFCVYGATGTAAVVFLYLVLPETKGKSLQDIDTELSRGRFFHTDERRSVFQRRRFSPVYQRIQLPDTTT